jgi:hypothetical protein
MGYIYQAKKINLFITILLLGCGCSATAHHSSKQDLAIVVLNAGAAPRHRLRYQPILRCPERVEMEMKIRIATKFANSALETGNRSAEFPTIRVAERVEALSLNGRGNAVVTSQIEEVLVLDDVGDPAIRVFAEQTARALKGLRMSYELSSTGRVLLSSTDMGSAAGAVRDQVSRLRDLSQEARVLFPDVEIGIGAQWQVTYRQSSRGIIWDRTVTYRLRGLADSTAKVDADVKMRAEPQALSVEPNATTRITSGAATARAQLSVPLRGLVMTSTTRGTTELNFLIMKRRLQTSWTNITDVTFSMRPLGNVAAPPDSHNPIQ